MNDPGPTGEARGFSGRRGGPAAGVGLLFALLPFAARSQGAPPAEPSVMVQVPEVNVSAPGAYAAQAQFHTDRADLGPLGSQPLLTTPLSVTVLPQDLLTNEQIRTVNDALRALPSVEVRDQQGLEVSRPQSRGFQGTIVQNTRLDGLNIIGTTAIATENLQAIQVLNGLAGSLYGPETPAGVFNYVLKRPTDIPLARIVGSYDSQGLFTEEADLGGRFGPNNAIGYRIDVAHGEGESFVDGSYANRTLASGDFDIHIDAQTVIQLDASHYEDTATGLPGSIVYGSGRSTILPPAIDPTRVGYGQPGAGTNLVTNTGVAKVLHSFGDDWKLELGGLYQDAKRNLFGITDTQTDNRGDYTVTKNFNAVPHFTIGSNEAYLNGHVRLFGFDNDVTLGTNGFVNGQYTYRNSIATVLGSANLANPLVFAYRQVPNNGGQYHSATLTEQSIIEGDTLHLNRWLAVQAVFNESFLDAKSYAASGALTSADTRSGVFSPTVSLIVRPTPKLTTYATFSHSVEEGEQGPAGSANVNQYLAPYSDEQYEIGAKYAVTGRLLLTLDAFRMTRPYAAVAAATNLFGVIGEQRNTGAEFFAQGDLTRELSVFGGVTYIDARLLDTGVASTSGGLVVGVPTWKTDVTADLHPRLVPGLGLTATVHYEAPRAATNTNTSFAPAFATLDLGVRYSLPLYGRHATARLGAINVTDKRYYSSVADGTIVGSPGANTAYPGTPRTILASLEFDL